MGGQYLVGGIYGPPVDNIRQGGTGASVTYTLGGMSASFNGAENTGTYPYASFMPHSNWTNELQWTYAMAQGTTDTDATRKAVNMFPVKAWGFYRVPAEMPGVGGIQLPQGWQV
jgi:hypothetical protein